MFSWDDPKDRVAVLQLNADLRHAQLELLSAECATDRLRLRFATSDIAQFGDEAVLSKAIKTAATLNNYYATINKRARRMDQQNLSHGVRLSPEQRVLAVSLVSEYLKTQRESYFHNGVRINESLKKTLRPFFSSDLLERVRTVDLEGCRLPNPDFYEEARKSGLTNLPQIRHMSSLTFIDVIVFNETVTERALFHGLVHAVQFEVLGLERYVDLFVRGFLRTKLHITVPLEAQAFELDSRFARSPEQSFCVEEQVRLWAEQDRY